MKYEYTKDMREISGFGAVGGWAYEEACRAMVVAGLEWLDANPGALPRAKDERGKALMEAMAAPVGEEVTGIMMQACVLHVLRAHQIGWDQYAAEMRDTGDE